MRKLAIGLALAAALSACGEERRNTGANPAEGEGEGEGPAEGEGEGEGPAEGEGEGEPCPDGEVAEGGECRVVFREIAAGRKYTCGLRPDGTVLCWGEDRDERLDPPEGTFEHLSIGAHHGCAITDQGRIRCWGQELIGDRGRVIADTPDGQFLAVTVATSTTCALPAGGYAECWGSNYQRQAESDGEGPFVEIVAGGQTFCGLSEDRTTRCWGYRDWEGDARAWQHLALDEVLCGIQVDSRAVECFEAREGEPRESPEGGFERVSVGRRFACGVTTDHTVRCWSAGDGPVAAPFPANNVDLVEVTVGFDHACALRSNGTVYCWGDNGEGQTAAP